MLSVTDRMNTLGRHVLPLPLLAVVLLASCGHDDMKAPPVAPAVSLSVSPTTIAIGQSATLTWSATNAGTCTAAGAWSGSQPTSGTMSVTPTSEGTASYMLTCGSPANRDYPAGASTGQMSAALKVSSVYTVTALVSNMAGIALHQDANLLNPWGIVAGPATPFWVANNHSNTSTIYDGAGSARPLVVTLPPNGASVTVDPTGIVFNGTQDFKIGGSPGLFIFSGEGGLLAAWNPAAGTAAVVTYPAPSGDSGGAIYKGLAIAAVGTANYLYATDFHNNRIDVFDTSYAKQSWAAPAFVDPNLPAGYAPYGIQAIPNGTGGATQLYVTYAMQDPDAQDNVNGAGLGLVDLYDTSGTFLKRLVSTGGSLNGPWGLALAPMDFGTLSGALLVGNFGDGKINAFDAATGTFLGTITDPMGNPFAMPGLWGIAFGNDHVIQPHNTLFFAAGVNDEQDGVYGRIDLGATPPVLQ
jgi:uncharacterized protein (TIGR03118 family)